MKKGREEREEIDYFEMKRQEKEEKRDKGVKCACFNPDCEHEQRRQWPEVI